LRVSGEKRTRMGRFVEWARPVWKSQQIYSLGSQSSLQQASRAGVRAAGAPVPRTMQSLFVVNKAGSLIFYRKFVDSAPQVSQNDQLHLASTFHGMQLLVQQLAPLPSQHGFGIETLETASFVLHAYRPETGVQFFVTADLRTENLTAFLVRPCPSAWDPRFLRADRDAARRAAVACKLPARNLRARVFLTRLLTERVQRHRLAARICFRFSFRSRGDRDNRRKRYTCCTQTMS
jgi:Sybindin-like family